MNIVEKVYGTDGIYNKLTNINSTKFIRKRHYKSVIPLNLFLTWSNKILPPKMQEHIDILTSLNSEFNIQIFDCEERREFIKNHFTEDILKPKAFANQRDDLRARIGIEGSSAARELRQEANREALKRSIAEKQGAMIGMFGPIAPINVSTIAV